MSVKTRLATRITRSCGFALLSLAAIGFVTATEAGFLIGLLAVVIGTVLFVEVDHERRVDEAA